MATPGPWRQPEQHPAPKMMMKKKMKKKKMKARAKDMGGKWHTIGFHADGPVTCLRGLDRAANRPALF